MINTLKIMGVMLVVMALLGLGVHGSVQAQALIDKKIFAYMDDSDTAYNKKKFELLKEDFMMTLSKLREKFSWHRASVDVIGSSGRVLWSGTIADIQSEKGLALKEAITFKPFRCHDLAGVFSKLDGKLAVIDTHQFTDIKIYFVSNLYTTPKPCSEDFVIDYPRLPPKGVDFVGILTQLPEITSIGFYGVHDSEMEIWGKALAGLRKWENDKAGRAFGMYQEAHTLGALQGGLEGINTR